MDLQVKYDPKELIPLEYESKIFNTIRESVVQMLDTLGCQRLAIQVPDAAVGVLGGGGVGTTATL